MGASAGIQNSLFADDILRNQKRASSGRARRKEGMKRRLGDESGEAVIQPFPGPGEERPSRTPIYSDAKREWYENKDKTGESFYDFGKRWRGSGSPWEKKEGAHILNEGKRAEMGNRGLNFAPGRAERGPFQGAQVAPLLPGGMGGDFAKMMTRLAAIREARNEK